LKIHNHRNSCYFLGRFKVWGNCRSWSLALWCSCICSIWLKFKWTFGLLLPWFVLKV